MPGQVGLEITWIPEPAVVAKAYFMSADRARRLSPALEACVQDVMIPEIQQNFDSQGRPPWPPLADSTIAQRLQQGFTGGEILVRSGELQAAVTSMDSWVIDDSSPSEQIAALSDPTGYGHFHIEGGNVIPQRDFTFISDEALDQMGELVLNWVVDGEI